MQIRLQYRFDIFGVMIIELLTVGGFLVLWRVIFEGQDTIRGLSLNQAVIYYLFVPVVASITSVDLASTMGKHIKDGFISNQLLKPFKIWTAYVLEELGAKVYRVAFILPLYIVIYLLLRIFEVDVHISLAGLVFAVGFAVGGMILNLVFDLMTAYSAFWIDDVWAFKHVKRFTVWIFGGVGFPLDIVPSNLKTVFTILPFRFFYYVPLSYLLGLRGTSDVLQDLAFLIAWIGFFSFVALVLWQIGMKKYGAYGN